MRIGWIGLGVQGLPLAINLAKAGHDVLGLDVAQEPMAALCDAGGRSAGAIGEIAEASEVAFICVAKDAQVLEVVKALVDNAPPGLVIVNHSTVSAETMSELVAMTDAAGIRLLDAPVSGGLRGAQDRSMSYMVGGDDETIAICEPLFRVSGPTILRTGAVGTATKGKLAHQVTIIGNILAMAEGMRLGVAAGLSAETVKQIIVGGLARSYIAETWGEIRMAPHAIPIFSKDLENGLRLADELGIEMPGAQLMRDQLLNIVP